LKRNPAAAIFAMNLGDVIFAIAIIVNSLTSRQVPRCESQPVDLCRRHAGSPCQAASVRPDVT